MCFYNHVYGSSTLNACHHYHAQPPHLHNQKFGGCFIRILGIFLTLLCVCGPNKVQAQQQTSTLPQWWNGPYATGDWFGGRTFLEDHGVKIGGSTTSIYYGVPTEDLRNNSVYCYNLTLGAAFDFGKMLGLAGLSGNVGIQWENGEKFQDCSAGNAFSPNAFVGYWNWRLKPIVLTYVTPELFGVREFLTLSGGWQNARDYFILQPSASFFQNNAFGGGGGLVENEVLFDGNYVAWGGFVKLKPIDWYYIQAGMWAAVPNALNSNNRGIYFALAQPPQRNGLFFMGETGVTPKWGPRLLPGKYAFGGYYWGIACRSFFGASYPGSFGFYWQADQMLYREPSVVALEMASHSKIGKNPAPVGVNGQPILSPQGLYAFSLLTFAPKFNNEMPLFFRIGLVYKGLIPNRDQDDLGVAFAFGNYSYYRILANRAKGIFIQRTNEAVLEADYRFQINRWLYAQPFFEYIMNPNGNNLSRNAVVVGIRANLIF